MCLIAFGWKPAAGLHLLVVANRDEFHGRPSAPLAFWPDQPELLAGRDIEAQGTWLGVSTRGRLAAVTNVRLPAARASGLRSRGALPVDYLIGGAAPAEHLTVLQASLPQYGPCNLLLADADGASYASSQPGVPVQALPPGLYGLSNATLDSPWPKTLRLKQVVAGWLARGGHDDTASLFAALADTHAPPDSELPNTGVGLAAERFVAPAFIVGRDYGTRCSTVIVIDAQGAGTAIERRFGPQGVLLGESRVAFRWPTQVTAAFTPPAGSFR